MLLLLALSTTIVRPTLEFTSPIDRLQRLRGGNTKATRRAKHLAKYGGYLAFFGHFVAWVRVPDNHVPQLVGCFNVLLGTAVVLAGVAIKLCAHEPIEDDFFPVPQLVVFMFVYDLVFPAIKKLHRVSVSR